MEEATLGKPAKLSHGYQFQRHRQARLREDEEQETGGKWGTSAGSLSGQVRRADQTTWGVVVSRLRCGAGAKGRGKRGESGALAFVQKNLHREGGWSRS